MIHLNKPIIVEGRYDKIALENVVDTLIIVSDGFGIFKNKAKCEMIRKLAEKNGIIIMTDSDSAGAVIRGYIKKIVGNAEIINVYVPCFKGKEKRKTAPSKEGFLGVEGMTKKVLLEAFKKSGVFCEKAGENRRKITKNDMFLFGFSGTADASLKRKALLRKLELPEALSPNAMLDVINNMYTYEEFTEVINNYENEEKEKS